MLKASVTSEVKKQILLCPAPEPPPEPPPEPELSSFFEYRLLLAYDWTTDTSLSSTLVHEYRYYDLNKTTAYTYELVDEYLMPNAESFEYELISENSNENLQSPAYLYKPDFEYTYNY